MVMKKASKKKVQKKVSSKKVFVSKGMNKNLIIGVVVVLLLVGVFGYLNKNGEIGFSPDGAEGGVEKSVGYDLSSLIDQGMKTDAKAVAQAEKKEREKDPIYQIMKESLTEEELKELEQEIRFEKPILEEEVVGEVVEEDFFLPKILRPRKTKSVEEIDRQIKKREIKIEVSKEEKKEAKKIRKVRRKKDVKKEDLEKEEIKKEGFFGRFGAQLRENWRIMTGRVIYGGVEEIEGYEEGIEDLPPIPQNPGPVSQIMNPGKNIKVLSFITGNAIVGVPDWSFDGVKGGGFLLSASSTEKSLGLQHFDLKLKSNFSVPKSVNGVIFSQGYYLNTHEEKWKSFDFKGTKVGSTGWLRHKAEASITLEDVTDEDYTIFLAYSCLKVEVEWDCNEGRWIIFVVETGETYYHGNIEDVPPMEYAENKDLDISNITSILEQFNVSVQEFQPIMHDIMIIAPQTDFEVDLNNVQKLDFYVRNLGNRDLTNLTFELDVGEKVLAEVVAADIPDFIEVNQTVQASVSLLLKERGKWKFPLFVRPKQEEVDTSDNFIMFNIIAGEPITEKFPTDPLDTPWNRKINYTIKEPYTYTRYPENSSLVIISGTDKIRTIFGGYYQGKSLNPTMKFNLEPKVVEEALFSTPFIASIHIGGEMLTGDREVVEFYVAITNEKNGKKYTTPLMQSQFKYYYNPKELIPDFEFCVNYTAEVMLVGRTNETIDILEPEGFNLCNFEQILVPFKTERLLKLDGNYIVVSGGFSGKYFEEVNIQYKVEFTDPRNPNIKYETPIIDSKDGFEIYKLKDIIKRGVNYRLGESFPAKIILIDNPQARGNASIKFGERDESLHFVWRGWDITTILTTSLELGDSPIKIRGYAHVYSTSSTKFIKLNYRNNPYFRKNLLPWETYIYGSYRYEFPRYYSEEVKRKINRETPFIFSIKDLNENKIVYEVDGNCPVNCTRRQIHEMDRIKPLPKFENGHTYEFSFKVIGKNSHLFIPVENMRLFYLDAFQFIVNNPITRTRFMSLENHPSRFMINRNENKNYIPRISMNYIQKNIHPDESTYKFRKINTNEREIKISELNTFGKSSSFRNQKINNDYEIQINGSKPAFAKLLLSITPLKKREVRIKKTSFNCKIGRYDMVCSRGKWGYSINYIDEVNDIMYGINLLDDSDIFLKKYRDNPKLYDAVVYDILSEIDRNPIVSFELPYYVENNFKNIMGLSHIGQYNIYNPKLQVDYHRPKEEMSKNCLFNESHGKTFGDYKIFQRINTDSTRSMRQGYQFNKVRLKVISIEDSEVVASKEFDDSFKIYGTDRVGFFMLPVDSWINSLNLNNNKHYKIDVEAIDGGNNYFGYRYGEKGELQENPGIYYNSKPFKYKNHYEKEVIEENANYIRKIPELKSTIMGPYDFVSNWLYPCVDYEWFQRLPISGLLNRGKHVFPEISYYNSYLNKIKSLRSRPNRFLGFFSVNPPEVNNHYPGEKTSLDEFRNNTKGKRKNNLKSDRIYGFSVTEFDNIYEYYKDAPVNYNTYDTELTGIVCDSSRYGYVNGSNLILQCKWSNIDELKIYRLSIIQYFPGKTSNDLYNLPDDVLNDYKNNFAEVVMAKYLDWYPPTPILNTTFYSY